MDVKRKIVKSKKRKRFASQVIAKKGVKAVLRESSRWALLAAAQKANTRSCRSSHGEPIANSSIGQYPRRQWFFFALLVPVTLMHIMREQPHLAYTNVTQRGSAKSSRDLAKPKMTGH